VGRLCRPVVLMRPRRHTVARRVIGRLCEAAVMRRSICIAATVLVTTLGRKRRRRFGLRGPHRYCVDGKGAGPHAAHRPHSFARIKQPSRRFLCVPRHFSSQRQYITADYLDSGIIAANATRITEDPDGLIFAVLSSSMIMAWQRAVGSRFHSDLRFSVTGVWNTFPLPPLDAQSSQRIIAAGAAIIAPAPNSPTIVLVDCTTRLAMWSTRFDGRTTCWTPSSTPSSTTAGACG
jgi:hypothetical protein